MNLTTAAKIAAAAGCCLALTYAAPSALSALTESDYHDCNSLDAKRMITGCTALIDKQWAPSQRRTDAFLKRGIAYFAVAKFDLAIADFEAARRLSPENAITYNELGLAHGAKGQHQRAITVYDEGIARHPESRELYYNRGISHMALRDIDQAIATFKQAVGLDTSPSRNQVVQIDNGAIKIASTSRSRGNHYHALAAAYIAKGNYDLAIATLDEAVQRFPDNFKIRLGRAQARSRIGDDKLALPDLDRAIELDETSSAAFGVRASVRFKTGDFTGSAADFARAWRTDPENTGIAKPYVPLWHYLTLAKSDAKAARAALGENVIQIDQANWPYPVARMMLGQLTPAQLVAMAKSADERCEAQFYIGEVQLLRGDKAAARTAFESTITSCPKTFIEFSGATVELARLDR